jgi:Concanavalin A-like lectin/glucanases superfamily
VLAWALMPVAGCRTSSEGTPIGPSPERPEDADPPGGSQADAGGPGVDGSVPDVAGGGVQMDAQAPDPALVGYWKLDEQGAMVAADSSGKNNPAALIQLPAATAWTLGRIGGAVDLTGGGAHLRVASSVSVNGVFRAVTVAAWVLRPAGAGAAGRATVLSRQGAYALGFEGDSPRWAVTVDARPTPAMLQGLEPAARGRWIHMAGTFDGNQARLFVEGREVAAVVFSGTIGSSMVPLTLGARLATTMADEALVGRLDDVRLYARALAPAEIAALAAP